MLRHFGLRRTFRYWRAGRRQGWMHPSQSAVILRQLRTWAAEGRAIDDVTDGEIVALLVRAKRGGSSS